MALAVLPPAAILWLWWGNVPRVPASAPPERQATVEVAGPVPPSAAALATTVPAGMDNANPPAPPPTPAEPVRGLTLSVQPLDAEADTEREVRTVRLLALAVPEGTTFSSRWPPGRFRATFTGEVAVDVRDRFTFVFEGTGELVLRVEDKVALEGSAREGQPLVGSPVRLRKGRNRLHAEYRSPREGPARMRVSWSTSEFAPEPIAPGVLSPGEGVAEVARAARARAAVERLQCHSCHATGGETVARGPDLRAAGRRLAPGWTFSWLLRPVRDGRAPRQMPHFFAPDAEGRQRAADVTAYLATLGGPPAGDNRSGDARAGGRLFAELGCVGCHLRPPQTSAADDRLSLAHVASKWRGDALVEYLRAPQRVDPAAAMPDFALTEDEASALAAFLREDGVAAPTPPAGDAGRGERAIAEAGCASCHALPAPAAMRARPWDALATDESGGDLCAGPPDYRFASTLPRAELLALRGQAPIGERAEAAIAALRCSACHARDGETDVWSRHAGEVADLLPLAAPDAEHAAPEPARPALTWAGEKLTRAWLHGLLTGSLDRRARPWLRARMPAFPPHAELLAAGLACGHGLLGDDPAPAPAPAPELAKVGADLVSAEKGFACVACHGVAGKPPLQVFEVQGIDFALTAQRLRHDFFLRWMRNPQRIDPGSKMPRYADARGKTAFVTVLGGEADRQFEAIWAWLNDLR